MRITVRKVKVSSGSSFRESRNDMQVVHNGRGLARISHTGSGGWYWYGLSRNTLAEGLTFPDREAAIADAKAAVKKHLEVSHG